MKGFRPRQVIFKSKARQVSKANPVVFEAKLKARPLSKYSNYVNITRLHKIKTVGLPT